jgi:acyl-CoA reductase-like NAD-dependent aldehyde dehydrogenase
VLARIIPHFLDSDCVKVVEGGVNETQALLAQPLDFIAFTGSHRVGKIIAKAAAEQMIPCVRSLPSRVPDCCSRMSGG